MALLCDHTQDGDPCGVCESCQLFLKERHFSYYELDAATYGGKEDMIKLRDDATFLSTSKKKIILLDEAHDVSRAGQDSLLKLIEQCPEHLVFIFCTTERDKMNSTLLNRCREFQISRVDSAAVAARLKEVCEKEGATYDEGVLREIAEKTDGHVRNALNLLEGLLLLGKVDSATLEIVSKDYDQDLVEVLAYLGTDVSKSLEAYRRVAPYIHPLDLYNRILGLVSDSCKLLYGYADFPAVRIARLSRLRDAHGPKLLEFLNYLITRDKFIDRIGVQSDLVVMHYKFASGGFVPPQSSPIPINSTPPTVAVEPAQQNSQPSSDSTGTFFYSDLSKLSLREKSRVLREQRNKKVDVKEESERVPTDWPLPKEEKPGQGIYDDGMLSPQDFSRNLVGGRGGSLQ